MLHGSVIGLTDDEAYYWVLAQKPALGYAYHPPAVAWFIALSERVLGWMTQAPHAAIVRLPGVLCMTAVLLLAARWFESAGIRRERISVSILTAASFAGMFSLAWMMVPDLPMLLGWTLMFVATWELCFNEAASPRTVFVLIFGTALALLSKYSTVLAAGSSGLSLLLWAPARKRNLGVAALIAGAALGALPAILWNAQHEWTSLLYQIRDRHQGGGLSLLRYGRFWASQIALAGPFLLVFAALLPARALIGGGDQSRVLRYIGLWIAPAALVFLLQPLWSDFKPHWAFIVWWPAVLGLAWASGSGTAKVDLRLAAWQRGYGALLALVVLVSCHLPVGSWMVERMNGVRMDPRLDVTNDLYGWSALPNWIREAGLDQMPVVGSRYQTASQAAFALARNKARVTLLPRDLKARDEWDDFGVSAGIGPEWPVLTAPVLYVADSRYTLPPEFPGASCAKLHRLETSRYGYPAKWIEVWKCEPAGS